MKYGRGVLQKFWKFKNHLHRFFLNALPPQKYKTSYQHEHVACVIVRNEAGILEEWILFHLAAGIQYFVIWDDHSDDGSRELLKPYEQAGLIEWRAFPYESFDVARQIKVYNHTINVFRNKAKWLWFLDSDEFVVPAQADSIPEIVREIEKDPAVGAITVNWLLFGTSDVEALSPGEWHIEKLTQRAPNHWKNHRATKGALRPEATARFIEQPHFPVLRKGRKLVYPNGKTFNDQYTHFDLLRVHHYWHRTESFYRSRKIARKEFLSGRSRNPKELQRHHKAYNQVFDDSIKRFIPKMKEIRKQILTN